MLPMQIDPECGQFDLFMGKCVCYDNSEKTAAEKNLLIGGMKLSGRRTALQSENAPWELKTQQIVKSVAER